MRRWGSLITVAAVVQSLFGGSAGDKFGTSVGLSGSTAVVGAPGANSGAGAAVLIAGL